MILHEQHQPRLSRAWRILILVKAVLLLGIAIWLVQPGQQATAAKLSALEQTNRSETDDTNAEQALIRMYEGMKKYMLEGDRAGFERLLAEDFIATSTRGTVMNRQQVIDTHIRTPTADAKLESVNFNEMRVRVYGDTAVVTYLAEFNGQHGGREFKQRARITDVWKRRSGQWLSVASHASTVAP